MNSALLAVTGLICFLLGYHYYSKIIAKKIYDLRNDIVTPAHELRDDIDYLPTKIHILFGHHYTSIAGYHRSFILKSSDFLGNNNVLFVINSILMILIVWMIVEGVLAVQRIRSSLIPGKYEKQVV